MPLVPRWRKPFCKNKKRNKTYNKTFTDSIESIYYFVGGSLVLNCTNTVKIITMLTLKFYWWRMTLGGKSWHPSRTTGTLVKS
jgi:hypothetical protein